MARRVALAALFALVAILFTGCVEPVYTASSETDFPRTVAYPAEWGPVIDVDWGRERVTTLDSTGVVHQFKLSLGAGNLKIVPVRRVPVRTPVQLVAPDGTTVTP